MSSDYYGAQAGELADQGAAMQGFYRWLDAWTRREADCSYQDELRAAFLAGYGQGRDDEAADVTTEVHDLEWARRTSRPPVTDRERRATQ